MTNIESIGIDRAHAHPLAAPNAGAGGDAGAGAAFGMSYNNHVISTANATPSVKGPVLPNAPISRGKERNLGNPQGDAPACADKSGQRGVDGVKSRKHRVIRSVPIRPTSSPVTSLSTPDVNRRCIVGSPATVHGAFSHVDSLSSTRSASVGEEESKGSPPSL